MCVSFIEPGSFAKLPVWHCQVLYTVVTSVPTSCRFSLVCSPCASVCLSIHLCTNYLIYLSICLSFCLLLFPLAPLSEIWSHLSQIGHKFTMYHRMTLDFWSPCSHLLSDGYRCTPARTVYLVRGLGEGIEFTASCMPGKHAPQNHILQLAMILARATADHPSQKRAQNSSFP